MIPYHLLSHCAIGFFFVCFFSFSFEGSAAWSLPLWYHRYSSPTWVSSPIATQCLALHKHLCRRFSTAKDASVWSFFHSCEAFSARHKEGCIVFPCSNTPQCSAVRCGAGVATGNLGEKKALGVMMWNVRCRFLGGNSSARVLARSHVEGEAREVSAGHVRDGPTREENNWTAAVLCEWVVSETKLRLK